ncbi:hypothetical protein D3C87_791260 [compost metagenome]|uniref:three component ABC system middle component n=1 Tax=Flavobacterium sp. GSB-24 TaxID=2994319 RepID=UPI000FC377D7|nr:three component ABC system middle component [Flavobacterium sp. GSB-24]BDU25219.1 hypothetical protein FLGSB24_19630 [Flavobacterium sp. GSB-24]
MATNKFLYNNEGVALVAILSVMSKMKTLEYSKVFLILPFLLNDNLVSFLKNKNAKVIGIQDLVSRRIGSFLNFNGSFKNFYALTFNAVCIAEELKFIKMESNSIIYLENSFDLQSDSLGSRAKNIVAASEKLQVILEIEAIELYSSLKIEL